MIPPHLHTGNHKSITPALLQKSAAERAFVWLDPILYYPQEVTSYLFAQAAELDKVYPQIVETMKDINAFNSGKKRNASLALLSQYAGKIQRFTAHLHETEEYVKELEKMRDELTKETDLQGEKLNSLELDFVAQENQINTLLSQMKRMQEVLDSLPPEVLEKAVHKEKER